MIAPTIRVLFASQTGTAEHVAKRIRRDLIRQRIISNDGDSYLPVISLDQMLPNLESIAALSQRKELWIIVCSTTGDGEEPDNMKMFWRHLLRRTLPACFLQQLDYAVFGLGDSSYPKYNFVAKKLWKRLQQLGATPLISRGDGDDQHYLGYHGALNPWLDELWRLLRTSLIPSGGGAGAAADKVLPAFTLLPPDNQVEILDHNESLSNDREENSSFAKVVVLSNTRITAEDHFQDIRHLELQFMEEISYKPGDILSLLPKNDPVDVNELIDLMQWQDIADSKVLRVISEDGHTGTYFIRELFTEVLDVFSTPKDEYFFELLSHFATNPVEKERLREFASAEGQEELYDYCYRARRTAYEILQDFPSVRIPLKYVCDLFPRIRARDFSISNYGEYSVLEGRSVSVVTITSGIVQYNTIMKKPRVGLCSGYLRRLSASDQVKVRVKSGQMIFPANHETPVIMVAPGLGVAPMRSFIYYRLQNRVSGSLSANMYLFFGCRYEQKDFLFKAEFEALSSKGKIQFYAAFSRDQSKHRRQYAQDKLIEQNELISSLLDNGAYVFICGGSKQMPTDVMRALKTIIQESNPGRDTEKVVADLLQARRIQTETW